MIIEYVFIFALLFAMWMMQFFHNRELRKVQAQHDAQMIVLLQTALIQSKATNVHDSVWAATTIQEHAAALDDAPPQQDEEETPSRRVTGMKLKNGSVIDFMSEVPDNVISEADDKVLIRS